MERSRHIFHSTIVLLLLLVLTACKQEPPAACAEIGSTCPDGSFYMGTGLEGQNIFTHKDHIESFYRFFSENFQPKYKDTYLSSKQGCYELGDTKACNSGQDNTELMAELSDIEQDKVHLAALACFCLGEEHENAPNKKVPDICAGDLAKTNTLDGHGHDDWYLPSIKELQYLYNEVSTRKETPVAKSFSNNHYLSSSVISGRRVWAIYFGSDELKKYDNHSSNNVRCLRSN